MVETSEDKEDTLLSTTIRVNTNQRSKYKTKG